MNAPAEPLLKEHEIIDKYRVLGPLGAGGMGAVFRVEHTKLSGVRFAMKVLRSNGDPHGASDERFEREAKVALRVKSKHAVKVSDFGKLPLAAPHWGAPYLVMELLEGDDLAAVLMERGRLPVEEAARYVHEACDALAELHDEDAVHRDIKPPNLFLVRTAKGRRYIKVLDFGIAKVMPTASQLTAKEMTGEFAIGTVSYMSPEQIRAPKTVDARTDIWALGVVLYEIVTGERPFQAETPYAIPHEIQTVTPALPSTLFPAIPPTFDAVVMRCLEKDRERRFSTAHELASALAPFFVPAPRESKSDSRPDVEETTRPRPAPAAPSGQVGPTAQQASNQAHGQSSFRPIEPTIAQAPIQASLPAQAPFQTPPSGQKGFHASPLPAQVPARRGRVSPVVWILAGVAVTAIAALVISRALVQPEEEPRPAPTASSTSSIQVVPTAVPGPTTEPTTDPSTPTAAPLGSTAAPQSTPAFSTPPKAPPSIKPTATQKSPEPAPTFKRSDPGGVGSTRKP